MNKLNIWIQKHQNKLTASIAILIVVSLIAKFLLKLPTLSTVAMIIASIIGAIPVALHAISALQNKVISIELLVTIAVVGAFIIGEYEESAVVTFLFLFGNFLEQKTLEKTRSSVKSLTKMAPTTAELVNEDGTTEEVDVDDLDEGDHVVVKPGGQIPVDGKIIDGTGYMNEASITGESTPVEKSIGDNVFAGSITDNGTITIETTSVGEDTTFGKIIELVEEAQDSQSPAARFIDKFATYYTPAVLIIGILVWAITQNFPLAITVLVLGCPGALVIGAPVSNVAGIGNGAKNGILMKGGNAVNTFSHVDTLVLDKTGTLTTGKMSVTDVVNFGKDKNEMMALLSAVENTSDHPLGQAIVKYAHDLGVTDDVKLPELDTVKGQGLVSQSDEFKILVGNERLMKANNVQITKEQRKAINARMNDGDSVVLMALDQELRLVVGVNDQLRPDAREGLQALKDAGLKRIVMLTGDNKVAAQRVAERLPIDEVHAELLPEDKVEFVKKFKEQGNTVAFVGDGINDSPSLATADIGIGMGTGTDVAIETSDIILVKSSFDALAHAYKLSKKTVANTKENIIIAVGTVALLLLGLVVGVIHMGSGMFVHELSILVVIFNAMRLIQNKPSKLDSNQVLKTAN
ncbi:heavy metal translocating P-type ATPase [Companilactobacillus bobalius]|uniref:Cd(2+)-exporting ATPase n=2 Tax=Companilactobacillus bobalius TaxID=2801451 RepID=A0A202FA21_9LACO|nr:cation-translocating P-type ATPase [Companilactobacillus bobalius]KAE9564295.1 HAD family hydrolase [Companilactobacillus bobalius]KRK83996.1 heavy metal translocating P-type ATPase [Companilactobacillus bobalius DSM 19674]OVE97315.1 Cadmium-exporting ATPase [Companilactobacillus bobalius]GEO58298.1 haloacid dehalogenase [Companilactobacillus paralimentarius]